MVVHVFTDSAFGKKVVLQVKNVKAKYTESDFSSSYGYVEKMR